MGPNKLSCVLNILKQSSQQLHHRFHHEFHHHFIITFVINYSSVGRILFFGIGTRDVIMKNLDYIPSSSRCPWCWCWCWPPLFNKIWLGSSVTDLAGSLTLLQPTGGCVECWGRTVSPSERLTSTGLTPRLVSPTSLRGLPLFHLQALPQERYLITAKK